MQLLESGILPDPLVRFGIRRICERRLHERRRAGGGARAAHLRALRASAVAEQPDAANAQHYEVPPEFFQAVLGRRLKYSCCTWSDGARTLDEAEEAALDQVVQRAQLAGGQRILELGCGWGSLSLYLAERFPDAQVTAVSNSQGQRSFIESRAHERGFANLQVLTADANRLTLARRVDRVVSVEMFEHMRNWESLLDQIAGWLVEDGKLFVHIFAHKRYAYLYEDNGPSDWMARHFFTGGQMPSEDLIDEFDRSLRVRARWRLDGTEYAKTSNAWLENLDANRDEAIAALARVDAHPRRAMHRWRIFFMACAELFAYRGGREWGVSHYLLEKGSGE